MYRRISALLKLEPSEVAITSVMFLYIFGVLTFYYILKPLRDGLFLQNFPSSDLPYAYMLTALFAGTIATLVFRFGGRTSLISLITVTNLGIIATLFLLSLGNDPGGLVSSVRVFYLRADRVGSGNDPVLDTGRARLRQPAGETHLQPVGGWGDFGCDGR